MSDVFVDSGWKFNGTSQLDVSVGGAGIFSFAASAGILHLITDFKENVEFGFRSAGGGAGLSGFPVEFSGAMKSMPSVGVVYANPAFRESLSLEDFTGPCLIYSGTAVIREGGSAAVMFFDVGKGVVASWTAFMASGGLAAPAIVPTIIASCSAMVACKGDAIGTPQAGVAGLLGYVDLVKGRRGSEDLCPYPWRVTTNGKDYSYIFHEDGRCYWYEYRDIQMSPDGKGKWRVVNNHIEINWESGSLENWNLPVSIYAQNGTWQTKESKVHKINAKFDLIKMSLVHKTM